VNIGDIVVLLGTSENITYTADDMAKYINSIGYEVVCDISKRVPRIYFNNGRNNLINNKNDNSYVIVQKAL
jgi:alanine racemase